MNNRRSVFFFSVAAALFVAISGSPAHAVDPVPFLVKDINPSGNSNPTQLTNVNGTLFFAATEVNTGRELWKSDGTEGGTVLVKDINTISGSSNPDQFIAFNGKLVFIADDGVNGIEPWISDGTEAGTVLLANINDSSLGSSVSNYLIFNNRLYFSATSATSGIELWVTDGTPEGTALFVDINPTGNSGPAGLTILGSRFYFRASDTTNGSELWTSDGTVVGTTLVKNIRAGGTGSFPAGFVLLNNKLLFAADDGTAGSELWITDGTEVGTVLLKDINPGSGTSTPERFLSANGLVYFSANDGTTGIEPHVSDGTPEGTVLLKNITIGGGGASFPNLFTLSGGMVFFTANDQVNGNELWKTDGTEAGTMMVKDISPGEFNSNPVSLLDVGGTLYFAANDGGDTGTELWKSDGTPSGTVLFADIRPGSGISSPNFLTKVNGRVFFAAAGVANNRELWAVDLATAEGEGEGTAEGEGEGTSEGEGEGSLTCPPGRAPDEAGQTCRDCAPGSYSADGLACLNCPEGTISDSGGAASCTACPPGTAPNVQRTACVPCGEGNYSADGLACVNCPAGTVTSVGGSVACEPCSPGTTPNGTRIQCDPCDAGSYSTDGITCLDCPEGTYSSSPGAVECAPCPDGQVPTLDRTACELPFDGYLRFIGATTDWHEPTNWSGGEVPGADDNVLLDGSDYVVLEPNGEGPVVINILYMKDDALLDLVDGVTLETGDIETHDRAGIEVIASRLDAASAAINVTPTPGKGTPKPHTSGFKLNPSAFSVDTALSFSPASILNMGIGGFNAAVPGSLGEGFHASIVADTVGLDGYLQLQLLYDYLPENGDTFTIINAASLSGQFIGLPEGALVDTFGPFDFTITYGVGDGHDVKLIATERGRATFIGDDGNWFEPTNWSTGVVPDENTDVQILSNVNIDPALAAGSIIVRDIYLDGGLFTTLPGTQLRYNKFHVGNGEFEARSSNLHGDELLLLAGGGKPLNSGFKLNPTSNDSRAIKIAANTPKGIQVGLGGLSPASTGNVGAGFHATLNADEIELAGGLGVELLYGFTPQAGDSFNIITASERLSGNFSDLPEGALVDAFGDVGLYISYASSRVTLTATLIGGEGEGEGQSPPGSRAVAVTILDEFTSWDPDGDGIILYADIFERIRELISGKGTEGESEAEDGLANAIFNELDKNGDNALTVGELRQTAEEDAPIHAADQNADGVFSLAELLRIIQLYNALAYECALGTEDGYGLGAGDDGCVPHTSDYAPQDFLISLSELLRSIQIYNSGGVVFCPLTATELDNFCPIAP